MTTQNDGRNDSADPSTLPAAASEPTLRQRAEEKARATGDQDLEALSPEETRRLLHELRVHQIELEMQNEELRRAQEALEASRARYFDLYDLAPVGYVTISTEALILEANLTAATLLGASRGALVKQPLTRFILSEDQGIYYRHRKQLFETGEPQVCEIRMVRQGGRLFWARLEATVAQDNDSGAPPVACHVVLSDITERKQAEEALQAYSERLEEMVEERTRELQETQEQLVRREKLAMLGQLAGGVGHELRNPLGAVSNAAYFLNMVLKNPAPEVKEALDIVAKEVRTSERIINSLLDFARTKPPIRREVDINDLIRTTLSHMAVPHNIEVVRQLDDGVPALLADPDQLTQAFRNVILNAIQAMPEGGRLAVKSEVASPERVAVSFADTGAGIPEENRQKIFEPLFTTKAKGIGLGLALVKTLVEAHGGTIELKSVVGKGSTFVIGLAIN